MEMSDMYGISEFDVARAFLGDRCLSFCRSSDVVCGLVMNLAQVYCFAEQLTSPTLLRMLSWRFRWPASDSSCFPGG